MTDVIFDGFFEYISSVLLDAQTDIKIAVAWLNFNMYRNIFETLLQRGVHLEIIINDDLINAKNDSCIHDLRQRGAFIYKIKMPTLRKYMHEKFCIIDEEKVLNGSYNWSLNANKNFENLMITEKRLVVEKFIYEFETIKSLGAAYIKELQKTSNFYIMVLEQDGDYTAIGTIYNIENGELGKVVDRISFDICVLANLEGISYKYDDVIDFAYDDPSELEEINKRIDFEVQQYLSAIRNTKTLFHIHAIGRLGHEIYHRHEDMRFIQVIWKERFCASAIKDIYYF
ncbi:hypothetical protein IMSAGC012_00170 [Lachnospiraceae bacterium]|nr:hypothetical protein IMSAGC012_00170 [Lachnospiraceae bacterium]GFI32994.1 hypothetical protein IMSAGC013_04401 [Lachnospiraceae bacterium]